MARNRGVVYKGPGDVAVEDIEYPKLEVPEEVASAMGISKEAPHGAIVRIISSGICGSDRALVKGRTTALIGQTLGHEFTGEVVERGSDVQFIDEGDICSVPFNIACGRCRNCNEGKTGVCLNVSPDHPGATYGYAGNGGWQGGQAEYIMVPFADFNLLKFPDRDQALEKILDLTMLSDIFPTGYHGAYTAQVTTGSTVYVAGAGPVGLAAAYSSLLLGAAVVIVGDLNEERLAQARSFGCETVNVGEDAGLAEQIAEIVGVPEVDSAVDAVGFKASGKGGEAAPAAALNAIQTITRAGGSLGIPGLYVTGDPGASDPDAQEGTLKIRFGLGWAKSHAFFTGQCPVKKYNRGLMMSILHDKAHIADAVNATVITLDEAPEGYEDFDQGAPRKYVLDPHKQLSALRRVSSYDFDERSLGEVALPHRYGGDIIEFVELSRRPTSPERVYRVKASQVDVGLTYITNDTRALVWDGVLDFSELRPEGLQNLSEYILRENGRETTVVATLILSTEESGDELVKYTLNRRGDQYGQYQLAMQNVDRIFFARYDVYHNRMPSMPREPVE
ncbi:MAG: formaldehyde dehydrogenase, glutathione-independent [Rubrobacter sp.]|nr:formaldehyde dehydrogenase, glutathione-independent [Rubrobacter sp.]